MNELLEYWQERDRLLALAIFGEGKSPEELLALDDQIRAAQQCAGRRFVLGLDVPTELDRAMARGYAGLGKWLRDNGHLEPEDFGPDYWVKPVGVLID